MLQAACGTRKGRIQFRIPDEEQEEEEDQFRILPTFIGADGPDPSAKPENPTYRGVSPIVKIEHRVILSFRLRGQCPLPGNSNQPVSDGAECGTWNEQLR